MPAAKRVKKYLSAVTRRRIQKMMDYAAAHPEQINQNNYPTRKNTVEKTCGVPFCSAGHAIIANDPKRFRQLVTTFDPVYWKDEARVALRIPDEANTFTLFDSVEEWPDKFRDMYWKAAALTTPSRKRSGLLKAFIARWQYVLDSDGAELR